MRKAAGDRVANHLRRRPAAHRAMLLAVPRLMPHRFDPEAAGDLDATFELRVRDPHGGEPASFAVRVANRTVTIRRGKAPDAGAFVVAGADDMVRLLSGSIGWPELLADKRLELGGSPFLALRFPKLFRLPAEATA
jgi:hypothetical protein